MDMILDMSNKKIVFLTLVNYICLSAHCNYLIEAILIFTNMIQHFRVFHNFLSHKFQLFSLLK